MATFKAEIKNKRADGICRVYIRCTHNRKNAYIKTDMYVHEGKVKNGEIKDQYVSARCANLIVGYLDKLNKVNIQDWSVDEVKEFILNENEKIPFYLYCEKYNKPILFTDNRIVRQHFDSFKPCNVYCFILGRGNCKKSG